MFSHNFSLHTDMNTQPLKKIKHVKKKKKVKSATTGSLSSLASVVLCPTLAGAALSTGYTIDFVGSHYQQDSRSVNRLRQWRNSQNQNSKKSAL